jgi:AraC family transcriptional regulator, positive regulator of tynA and feaB
MGLSFVTTDADASTRLKYWNVLLSQYYGEVQCKPKKPSDFQAQVFVNELGPGQITVIRSGAATYSSISRARNVADREDCLILLSLGGAIVFGQHGESTRVNRGDLILIADNSEYTTEFNSPAHFVVCRLPLAAVGELIFRPERYSQCVLDGLKGINAILRAILSEAGELEIINTTEQAQIYRAIVDLLATCLRQHRGGRGSTLDDPLVRSKRHMLKHLYDPDLDAQRVADAVGISVRTLYRRFSDEGTTFMRWLMMQRIEESYKALADGCCRDVTDAALSFGFRDLSHFSRLFSRRFKRSPRTVFRSHCLKMDRYTVALVRNSRVETN